MFLNETVGQAEAEPGAFPHLLGGKEGIKDFLEILLGDAWPIVLKGDVNEAARDRSRNVNGPFWTAGFDGLPGVIDEIEEDLLDLVRVCHDLRQRQIELG